MQSHILHERFKFQFFCNYISSRLRVSALWAEKMLEKGEKKHHTGIITDIIC